MAESVGFIQCDFKHCEEIVEVKKAGGRRGTLYTICPSCGTNQGTGTNRQTWLNANLKASREEVENSRPEVTEEKAAEPNKTEVSSEQEQAEEVAEVKPEIKPKRLEAAPPALLGIMALLVTVVSAFLATKKSKEKTV
ncbi:hypothetical protein [Marinomonas foliarum]|uniref:Uncharacterized protein n=1 Tax=Marinomonas foliarum TaxID=491950 RepID=A0A369ACZ9_9GAMM|nr:hypothetical protein [Marinomonas foliarum]RCX07043.1 hypothetical protein DFP77_107143 [Marinomonas foliarum]